MPQLDPSAMPARQPSFLSFRPSLHLVLFSVLLAVLWLAGGASRGDALGQVPVRVCAWGVLIVAILFGERPSLRGAWPVFTILLLALALAAAQLVPLPPAIWQGLPGREVMAQAAMGQAQPWRPLAIVPGAAVNAVSSLIVPFATLWLVAGLTPDERRWLPGLLLAFVAAATFLGLLQVSGVRIDNPFINDTPGEIGGIFANRNHFAMFLAIGCLLATAWVFPRNGDRARGRGLIALGASLLFLLTILATGSRGGMLAGGLAVLGGLMLAWRALRRQFRAAPRWLFVSIIIGIVMVIALMVLVSIAADRAVSINRAFALDVGQDMRSLALPVVLEMIRAYMPLGSGLGGFDPIFRIHEPLSLLRPTYFNHAHNDYLEIALDAGVAGLALLVGALFWWARASLAAWRDTSRAGSHARLGSAILAIVIVASVFDYPVRTPTIMAFTVIAGLWLAGFSGDAHGSALPEKRQQL